MSEIHSPSPTASEIYKALYGKELSEDQLIAMVIAETKTRSTTFSLRLVDAIRDIHRMANDDYTVIQTSQAED